MIKSKKALFILIVFILLISKSFADIQEKLPVYLISASTGVLCTGLRVGAGYVFSDGKHSIESTINYETEFLGHQIDRKNNTDFIFITPLHFGSAFLQTNIFWNPYRERSFLFLRLGVIHRSDIEDFKEGLIIPALAAGYGYSYKGDNYFVRPSISLGLQPSILNIDLSFIF